MQLKHYSESVMDKLKLILIFLIKYMKKKPNSTVLSQFLLRKSPIDFSSFNSYATL